MIPTRRAILMLSGATLAAAVAPAGVTRASNGVRRAISDFTGGKQPVDGGVRLDVPEIADNGGAVPVVVAAEGARRIALFADGNPRPGVVVFSFGRLAASFGGDPDAPGREPDRLRGRRDGGRSISHRVEARIGNRRRLRIGRPKCPRRHPG